MAVTEERLSRIEELVQKIAYEHLNTEIIMQESARRSGKFGIDIEELKALRREDSTKMQAERAEMNRKWGELANKMGTVVEDIVAPNIPTIAQKYFGVNEFEDFALNYRKKHPAKKGLIREFDVIAVSETYLFLNETKSTPRQEYLEAFAENHREIFDYFPEHKGKTLIPIFSSLSLPESAVAYLSKNGIYAMAMKGDTMDLLNFDEVAGAD